MDAEPPSSPETSGYPPADAGRRALARLCDSICAAAPFFLLGPTRRPIAALIAMAIVLCGDRLFGPGRSLGKRLAGLRVIVVKTRQPGGITASMRRNLWFAASLLPLAIHSQNIYITFSAIIGIASIEAAIALLPLTRDLGRRRLGDLLAGTQVIDASIPLALAAAKPARPVSAQPISASHRNAA